MTDHLPPRVKEILELQSEDPILWFGNDIEYVRHHLRKLHGALEREDTSWLRPDDRAS